MAMVLVLASNHSVVSSGASVHFHPRAQSRWLKILPVSRNYSVKHSTNPAVEWMDGWKKSGEFWLRCFLLVSRCGCGALSHMLLQLAIDYAALQQV